MTVLLIGGTGLLGGAIAAELVRQNYPVRALVRTGKGAARLRGLGIELEVGDVRDARALRRAFRDQPTVMTTAQGNPLSRSNPMRQIDGSANQHMIVAARKAGVPRFVFVSALKADQGAATVPQLAYKFAAENVLQASGIPFTILRPSSFQETFDDGFAPFKRIIELAGVGLTMGSGRGRHSFVAVRDGARAAVLSLAHPEALGQIVPVGGPDDLSYREAYRQIAKITGRRVVVLPAPRIALKLGGLLATPVLPELGDFFAFFEFFDRHGYTCATPEWLVRALGRRRSFDEAVRDFYGVNQPGVGLSAA